MPLIICPDCEKQISNRVEACPFCGCPAKYFSDLSIKVEEDICGDNNEKNFVDSVDNSSMMITAVPNDKIIFSFGKNRISYPKATEKISKLYGKYVIYAYKYQKEYYEIYLNAGSMAAVLTNVTEKVIDDLHGLVEEACKDLYFYGIKITSSNFESLYKINFKNSIEELYTQYNNIKQEKEDIAYRRQLEKAGRGRWQGGGFGMKGAIKGAVNAAVLNAGSDLLHSIGDGIQHGLDSRQINNKLKEIYNNEKNHRIFAGGVYECIRAILDGIITEMSEKELIDDGIFGHHHDVYSNYETVLKYENSRENLFEGMVQCFSCIPEEIEFYEPVLAELFELETDIESFFAFWGLSIIYENIESQYEHNVFGNINNLFVKNTANKGIIILEKIQQLDYGSVVKAKVVKDNIHPNEALVLLSEGFRAGICTEVLAIKDNKGECNVAKIGRIYEFVLSLKLGMAVEEGDFLVDEKCFEKPEADLYVEYYKDNNKIIWSFDNYCHKTGRPTIFTFYESDKYISSRNIDFTSDVRKVKMTYGNVDEQDYDEKRDVVNKWANENKKIGTINALYDVKYNLTYLFEDEYIIRFYFGENNQIVLVAYLCGVDISNEVVVSVNNVSEKRDKTAIKKIEFEKECHKCGKVFKFDMKFCNYCGEPNPLFWKECSECKRMVGIDKKYCNYCGHCFLDISNQ